MAWTLDNGTDPERLQPSEHPGGRFSRREFEGLGVSDRTAFDFASMVALITDA